MLFKWFRWVLLAASLAPPAQAQALVATEGALQAALLVNFAVYTDWPALPAGVQGTEKMAFCVMASPEVAEALASRQNKSFKGKTIDVKTITSAAQATACQVLFVGAQAHAKLHDINQLAQANPILVVAEENGFDPKDVTISLLQQEGRYTFKINWTAALARSLSMSSKLLKLATEVY
jgi:hypothetical protein